MLALYDRSGLHRRQFLRLGGLTLGGLSLSHWLAWQQALGAEGVLRDKAVVFLFMHGGPTQTETFDPKMTAPAEYRSVTGEIQTTVPGLTFGSTFHRLARLAHKLVVVRSFVPGDNRHDIKPVVCRATGGANLGSLYARVAGTNNPVNGMPTNALLFPRAVDPNRGKPLTQFGRLESTGSLGAAYAPFVPSGDGTLKKDMQLNVPMKRLDDRRWLLARLDRLRRTAEANPQLAGLDRLRQQAFQTLLGGIADVFDLSKEDPRVLARYDTAPLVRPDQINRKWRNYNHYVDNAMTLGKLLLLARRMIQHGCRFVTVTTSFVWDMHADVNNATVYEGMRYMGVPFDHAVSAFIEDLEAHGLEKHVLLVCCGEMGRTPKLNARGGRDHWGQLGPLLLYGGGLEGGQVIGQSDQHAARPHTAPVTIGHLIGTIMHTLLDVGQVRLMTQVPQEVRRIITDNEPIAGLRGLG